LSTGDKVTGPASDTLIVFGRRSRGWLLSITRAAAVRQLKPAGTILPCGPCRRALSQPGGNLRLLFRCKEHQRSDFDALWVVLRPRSDFRTKYGTTLGHVVFALRLGHDSGLIL
jgi:hypothetical protein